MRGRPHGSAAEPPSCLPLLTSASFLLQPPRPQFGSTAKHLQKRMKGCWPASGKCETAFRDSPWVGRGRHQASVARVRSALRGLTPTKRLQCMAYVMLWNLLVPSSGRVGAGRQRLGFCTRRLCSSRPGAREAGYTIQADRTSASALYIPAGSPQDGGLTRGGCRLAEGRARTRVAQVRAHAANP